MGNVGKFNHVATDSSGGQATARWYLPDMMIASRDQQGVSASGSNPLDRVHLEPPPLPTSAAALFLDLDGTLLDFAPDPQAVIVPDNLREDLVDLNKALQGAVAIISGRSLAEIDRICHSAAFAAAGLHGAQLRHGSNESMPARGDDELLAELRRYAAEKIEPLSGVRIEAKLDAIALHYRGAPQHGEAVERIADELLHIAGTGYRIQPGDHVFEVRPRGFDKGTAIGSLMASAPFHGRIAYVIGDDFTDEAGFLAIRKFDGFGVIVGTRRPTAAHYAFDHPAAVRAWLRAVVAALKTSED